MRKRMRQGGWLTAAVLACLAVLGAASICNANLQRVYVIVNHPDAPIEIVAFGKYVGEDDDHIYSIVRYRNRTGRSIEAQAITMLYFDAFNEREAGVKGISTDLLPANQESTGGWSIYGTPGFVKTAMAFVSAVRFMDGEVWRADIAAVLEAAAKLPGLEFLSKTEMLEIKKD